MVRPRKTEDGKRRLMVSEEAFDILQQISEIANLSGAGAAADTMAKRYGELMRADYEALTNPAKSNARVSHRLATNNTDVIPFPQQELDNSETTQKQPKERKTEPKEPKNETNPLTDLLKGFG